MNNSVTHFEDAYWQTSRQGEEYRHRCALGMLSASDAPVVDIGCGDGFFLQRLKEKGIHGWGVDISPVAVRACREKGLDAEALNFSNGDLPDKEMRTAVMLDVLEHMYDPIPILRTLHRRADALILTVPNFVSLPARLQVLRGKVPENNTPRKGHVYWYTLRVLRERLQETGWDVVELHGNAPWERKPILGPVTRALARIWPSAFALSFAVKARSAPRV